MPLISKAKLSPGCESVWTAAVQAVQGQHLSPRLPHHLQAQRPRQLRRQPWAPLRSPKHICTRKDLGAGELPNHACSASNGALSICTSCCTWMRFPAGCRALHAWQGSLLTAGRAAPVPAKIPWQRIGGVHDSSAALFGTAGLGASLTKQGTLGTVLCSAEGHWRKPGWRQPYHEIRL